MIKNVVSMTRLGRRLSLAGCHLALMVAVKALMARIFQIYLVLAEIFFQHYLVELANVMAQIYKLRPQFYLKMQSMELS